MVFFFVGFSKHFPYLTTMDEITEGWSRLSLQGPEGDGFNLRAEMGSEEFVLAAKFFTKRVLNTDAIARNFSQLWRSWNDFKIKDLGNHIVLFIFDNKLEADRVLASQPWSFDKFLVAIQWYEKSTPARDLVFDKFLFGCKFMIFPLGSQIRWWLKGYVLVLEKFSHQISL